MVCFGKEQRSFCCSEIASKYCIVNSFVDHYGYSISSEGFLPTVKDLHDPDNHNGVIIDLEPDILECEVKWALVSITMNKASGGDGLPAVGLLGNLFYLAEPISLPVV